MQSNTSKLPALPLALGVMSGVLVYANLCGDTIVYESIAIICSAIAFLIWRKYYISTFLFSVFAGVFLAWVDRPIELPASAFDTSAKVYAAVLRESSVGEVSQKSIVTIYASGDSVSEMSSLQRPFRCKLIVTDIYPEYDCGDTIVFTSELHPLRQKSDIPFGKDVTSRDTYDRVSATAVIAPSDIHSIVQSRDTYYKFRHFRRDIADAIYLSPLSVTSSTLLVAALLGEEAALDSDIREHFRATGVAHLLCVSGFHVGVIAAVVSLLLFPLRLWTRRGRYRHLVTIAVIWLYAVVVGLEPSVVRASVMLTLFLSARMLQRTSLPYNTLAMSIFVILLIDPYAVFSTGFYLSIFAVLGLLVFASKLNPIHPKRVVVHKMFSLVSVPVSAMLGILPIQVYIFHTFPLLFIPANMIASILFTPFIVSGAIVALASSAGLHSSLLTQLADTLSMLMTNLMAYISELSVDQIGVLDFSLFSTLALTVAVAAFACCLYVRQITKKSIFLMLACVALCLIGLDDKKLPQAELYLCRDYFGNIDMVIRDGNNAALQTFPEPINEKRQLMPELCQRRYAQFYTNRHVDKVDYPIGDFEYANISRKGNIISFNGRNIYVVGDISKREKRNAPMPVTHLDYLLLCKNYNDGVDSLFKLKPDTILIGQGIRREKRHTIIQKCTRKGQAYIDLYHTPWCAVMP